MTVTNDHYYDGLFARQIARGRTALESLQTAAEAFLDGKPAGTSKQKRTGSDRHWLFWTSLFLADLPAAAWTTEPMTLALARYLAQESYAHPTLLQHVGSVAPDAVRHAARHSGLVLRRHSPRWLEVQALANANPTEFADFVRVLELFNQAYQQRCAEVASCQKTLNALTPLELLTYASLYAFEFIVPPCLGLAPNLKDVHEELEWAAINDIVVWKLTTCAPEDLQLSEAQIGVSLKQHLSPFIFPSRDGSLVREDLVIAFRQLMAAQMELNSFISQSADAFSYDDSIRFVLRGNALEIVELDPLQRIAWVHDSEKLIRLHMYWLYRGMEALMASPATLAMVGRENWEANLQAFAKAMGTQLQLHEVYGLADTLQTESGLTVDVFRALLAMELMTAFFLQDFMRPFGEHLRQSGNARMALGRLAFAGLLHGDMQNRFPITWSDKAAKIERIKSWTVSPDFPQGNAKAAEAILDFWTSDWQALSAQLRGTQPGLRPELLERPMLKMGRYLFQLPWMVALQNNSTAAINNLRRLGARRQEAREETHRIEQRLAEQFERRGFSVRVGYQPEVFDNVDAGEIDLICARDGHVLVLEVKSTSLRRSQKEAWIHETSVLRKAGLQLQRKLQAVKSDLSAMSDFRHSLGLSLEQRLPVITGWIVDTSIECDHQRFSGFLKISLEEVLIALRDDRHLLNDPEGFCKQGQSGYGDRKSLLPATDWTFYKEGFSAQRFIEVIEQEQVWAPPQ